MEENKEAMAAGEEEIPEMEEMRPDHEMLSDDALDQISGGQQYKVKETKWLFCPYCNRRHNVSVAAGKYRLPSGHLYTFYICSRNRRVFVKAVNGYFDKEGNRIYTNTVNAD